MEARQKWVRETLWKLIGGMPVRTPLNARTTGSFEREKYKVEKSRPGLFISANLYLQSQSELSALLPGPGTVEICGARLRPDGTGRSHPVSGLDWHAYTPIGRRLPSTRRQQEIAMKKGPFESCG